MEFELHAAIDVSAIYSASIKWSSVIYRRVSDCSFTVVSTYRHTPNQSRHTVIRRLLSY